jgi:hypothetical protein
VPTRHYSDLVSYSLPLTRSEAIARHLGEEIVTGQLAPGTVIKDAELADRPGVMLTPSRSESGQAAAQGLEAASPDPLR